MSCPPLDCPPDALPVHVESQCCKICKGEYTRWTFVFSLFKQSYTWLAWVLLIQVTGVKVASLILEENRQLLRNEQVSTKLITPPLAWGWEALLGFSFYLLLMLEHQTCGLNFL